MEIAGVRFCVNCRDHGIFHGLEPHYREFLGRASRDNEVLEADIRLVAGEVPDTAGLTKIFHTGQSWSMYRNGGDYVMTLDPPVAGEGSIWTARINGNFTRVIVYCSERLMRERDGRMLVSSPVRYPLDQILMMYVLARNGGALFHAAGVDVNGRGLMLPGPSGAGKSTISRHLAARSSVEVLSDDRIVVREIDGTLRAFGTPWPGEVGIAANASAPLRGIYFISHGDANMIEEMKPREALEVLLPVTSIPWYDGEVMPKVLAFCEDLVAHVPAFRFYFTPNCEAAEFLENLVSA